MTKSRCVIHWFQMLRTLRKSGNKSASKGGEEQNLQMSNKTPPPHLGGLRQTKHMLGSKNVYDHSIQNGKTS